MTFNSVWQSVKDWWNTHPAWHEKIILTGIGIAIGFTVAKVL